MIRFRHREDEERFLRLLGQAYRDLARHLPPEAANRVLRNLAKIHDILMLEGVRQGLAVAALGQVIDDNDAQAVAIRQLKAFQAHAVVYGSSDTPLRDVELEWLRRLGIEEDEAAKAWLDAQPLRFAPSTLAEVQESVVSDVPGVRPIAPEEVARRFSDDLRTEEEIASDTMPAFLDQIRDQIQAKTGSGWSPASWAQLVLDLHRATGTDAAFLDLQLSSPTGLTMLAQCGIHVSPGFAMFLSDLEGETSASDEEDEEALAELAEAPAPLPGSPGDG